MNDYDNLYNNNYLDDDDLQNFANLTIDEDIDIAYDYNANTKLNNNDAIRLINRFPPFKKRNNKICIICQEDNVLTTALPCCDYKQFICKECLTGQLINIGPECPICRKNFIEAVNSYQSNKGRYDIIELNDQQISKYIKQKVYYGHKKIFKNLNIETNKSNKGREKVGYLWFRIPAGNKGRPKLKIMIENLPTQYQKEFSEFIVKYKKYYDGNKLKYDNDLWRGILHRCQNYNEKVKNLKKVEYNIFKNFLTDIEIFMEKLS